MDSFIVSGGILGGSSYEGGNYDSYCKLVSGLFIVLIICLIAYAVSQQFTPKNPETYVGNPYYQNINANRMSAVSSQINNETYEPYYLDLKSEGMKNKERATTRWNPNHYQDRLTEGYKPNISSARSNQMERMTNIDQISDMEDIDPECGTCHRPELQDFELVNQI
jgi:hypothetical protein